MKVLFLCGVFAEENEQEIIEVAKRPIEYSANVFQKKMIRGFEACGCDLEVVSAPFIGSYPNASKIRSFKGFKRKQTKYHYVNFNNIWGIRNLSRTKSLKRAIGSFVEDRDKEKLIVVYSPHTPFLEAAVYAKRVDPSTKICLVLPDLPQYMNLDAKISILYKLGKKFDVYKFNQLNKQVDSYMLLTEGMKEQVALQEKPYIVVEGIVDEEIRHNATACIEETITENRYIVYTGKLNEKFGVKHLVDAFSRMENSEYRLVLCGKGDAEEYVIEKSKEDTRIVYLGQVTPDEAKEWVSKASVLVNPRQNNEEYTKYSFPSKNIEYLMSGKPVVAYMLDGIPGVYSEFMYIAEEDSAESLATTIEKALNDTKENQYVRYNKACEYFKTLAAGKIAQKLLRINFE